MEPAAPPIDFDDMPDTPEPALAADGRGVPRVNVPNSRWIANRGSLATGLKISPVTIDKLFAEGAPMLHDGRGSDGKRVDVGEFVKWYVRRETESLYGGDEDDFGFEAAKRRDKAAQAQLREFELAEAQRLTIARSDAVAIYSRHVGEFRNRLLELPDQVTGIAPEQRAELEAAIDRALGEFSGLPEPGEA